MRWILAALLVTGRARRTTRCLSTNRRTRVWSPIPRLARPSKRSCPGAVDEPIVPGSWMLTANGKFKKLGGNELEGTYVFTGDHLVVSALGPALDYEIKKRSVDITNETRFDRKK
jgi:hypothetical protein